MGAGPSCCPMAAETLITGASGFVGRRLHTFLEAAGHAVAGLSLEEGDLASCEISFSGIHHVFHLAARTYVPESWNSPRLFYQTNVLGTVNVAEFCRRAGAALTLVSSYVYGPPERLPIGEDHPVQAFNPYAQTKIMAEQVGRFYAAHHGVRVTIIRPFNLYGPGQDERFLIPTLARQVVDPRTAEIRVADHRPRRDFLFVDDFIALLAATLQPRAQGTYNAGSGVSVSIDELAALLNRAAGQNKPVVGDGAPRPSEVLDVVADISKAAAELGWRPSTSLEDGLRQVVDSLRKAAGG